MNSHPIVFFIVNCSCIAHRKQGQDKTPAKTCFVKLKAFLIGVSTHCWHLSANTVDFLHLKHFTFLLMHPQSFKSHFSSLPLLCAIFEKALFHCQSSLTTCRHLNRAVDPHETVQGLLTAHPKRCARATGWRIDIWPKISQEKRSKKCASWNKLWWVRGIGLLSKKMSLTVCNFSE